MHFSNLNFLYFLYGVPVAAFFLFLWIIVKRKRMKQFGDDRLVERLTGSSSLQKRIAKAILIICALIFFILTGAGPQWGMKMERISRKGVDVAFAIDISKSMLAEDVKPNRLEMAKRKIDELLKKLSGDRVSLIAFAGEAFVHCPPTLDYSAFKVFLDSVDTEMSPTPGTDYAEMFREAERLFATSKGKFRVLIIVSDGEDHDERSLEIAKEAHSKGIIIHTIGIGSETGMPIPLRNERGEIDSYKKDREGKAVTTRLSESYLQKIAITAKGAYVRGTVSGDEVGDIAKAIASMDKEEFSSMIHSVYEEKFQYPLGILILILLAEQMITTRRKERKEWTGRI